MMKLWNDFARTSMRFKNGDEKVVCYIPSVLSQYGPGIAARVSRDTWRKRPETDKTQIARAMTWKAGLFPFPWETPLTAFFFLLSSAVFSPRTIKDIQTFHFVIFTGQIWGQKINSNFFFFVEVSGLYCLIPNFGKEIRMFHFVIYAAQIQYFVGPFSFIFLRCQPDICVAFIRALLII